MWARGGACRYRGTGRIWWHELKIVPVGGVQARIVVFVGGSSSDELLATQHCCVLAVQTATMSVGAIVMDITVLTHAATAVLQDVAA